MRLHEKKLYSIQTEQKEAKEAADSALKNSEQIPTLKTQLQKHTELSEKRNECVSLSEQLKKCEEAQKIIG